MSASRQKIAENWSLTHTAEYAIIPYGKAGMRRLKMFEKYKKQREERGFLGMSGKEVTRIVILVLFGIIFLVFVSLQWPATSKKPPEEEGVVVPQVRRAGDREAPAAFEIEKEKGLLKQRETGEIPLAPGPLEYPKPPTPFVEEPGIWSQVDDNAVNVLEEKPLNYALHQINSMTQEEIEKRVKEDGNLTEDQYCRNPAKYRGKFVSITGTLIELEWNRLPPNRSGLNMVWVGTLYNQQNMTYRKYYFYVTRKDAEYITNKYAYAQGLARNGDLVRLDGIFVKLYRAEVEGGNGAVLTFPFVVGRELIKIEEPTYKDIYSSYPWFLSMTVVMSIMALAAGVIFIAARRASKARIEFKKGLLHKLGKRVNNEFIRAHSKRHKVDQPIECDIEGSGPESEPTSGESPAAPHPGEPET